MSHIAFRGVKTNAKNQTETKRFNWPVFKEVVKDWQLYLQALVYWSNVVPNYVSDTQQLRITWPTEDVHPPFVRHETTADVVYLAPSRA